MSYRLLSLAFALIVSSSAAQANPIPREYAGSYEYLASEYTDRDKVCRVGSFSIYIGSIAIGFKTPNLSSTAEKGIYIQISGLSIENENISFQLKTALFERKLDKIISNSVRCEIPNHIRLILAETLSVYEDFAYGGDQCRTGDTNSCIKYLFDILDIAQDEKLSPAELARGLRAGSFFAAYYSHLRQYDSEYEGDDHIWVGYFANRDAVLTTFIGMNALAPIVASNLINSYDYNADGFISLDEFLQDRSGLSIEDLSAQITADLSQSALPSLIGPLFSGLMSIR